MNAFLLTQAAENIAETGGPDTMRLVIEYIAYAVVIIVGIVILLAFRRASRPPKHTELKKQLEIFAEDLTSVHNQAQRGVLPRLRFIKLVSKLTYRADKLAFTTDGMAEKERDGDLAALATLLEQAHTELSVYRYGTHDAGDFAPMEAAKNKLTEAIGLLARIIERDKKLSAKRASS